MTVIKVVVVGGKVVVGICVGGGVLLSGPGVVWHGHILQGLQGNHGKQGGHAGWHGHGFDGGAWVGIS